MSELEVTPLDPHDEAALKAYHAAYYEADTFERPHAAPWQLHEMRVDLTASRPGESSHPWLGTVDGVVVAVGMMTLPLKDNTHLAFLRPWVPPAHRRRGYGSAMLEHLVAECARAGRKQILSDTHVPYSFREDGRGHPDADFAYARGWSFDMCDIVRVLPLPLPEGLLDRLCRQYVARASRPLQDVERNVMCIRGENARVPKHLGDVGHHGHPHVVGLPRVEADETAADAATVIDPQVASGKGVH